MQVSAKQTNTFQRLRLIDKIDAAAISRGAASLLSFIERRGGSGWYEASGEFLAAGLKASRRSVVRWLAELRAAGLIVVWRRSAVRDGVRVAAPSRYRVVTQALVDAAGDAFHARAAALKAKLRAAFAAISRKALRPAICANLAQSRDQEGLRVLWKEVGQAPKGSPGWLAAVDALISAGQAESRADFEGLA